MPHACACHAVVSGLEVTSLLIRSNTPAAYRRFILLLVAHGVRFQEDHQTVTVLTGIVPQLQVCLSQLAARDLVQLLAVPCTAGGPQYWEARPLTTWVDRVTTPWFAQVSEQLIFYAQPIMDLRSGQLDGYEALVRAMLDERVLGAGELLGAATAHEQLRAFDALCRTSAIRQLYPRLMGEERLYINFSPGVVYDPAICLEATFQACREVGAEARRLVFEITEGEAFPELPLLRRILERYQEVGARIALDDLGSGHANLTLLRELKPDLVKLDRGLIQGLDRSAEAFALVRSLTEYAHALGAEVVAEGIETPEELSAVRRAGADYAQGFFLGRPDRSLIRPSTQPLPGGPT